MLPNTSQMTHRDLKVPSIKESIEEFCQRYRDRLEEHSNNLAVKAGIVRKLKRKKPTDLLN